MGGARRPQKPDPWPLRHHVGALVVVDELGRLAGIATMEDMLELLANELSALTVALRCARDREFEQRR